MLRNALLAATFVVAGNAAPLTAATDIPQSRIDEILAMDPTEMARTGAFTTAAYDRLMGYINSIENPELRTLVLDMYETPESTVFNATASADALRTAPATGGPGHHHYPGGLAVHLVEVMEIALGWIEMFDSIHGVRTMDRDLVIAQLALHDWSKVWYNWDKSIGKVAKPEWFPDAWGGKDGIAHWGWMGEHGAVVYAELLKRGAPQELLFGAASTHFDPHWDVATTNKDGKDEGFNAAMIEAAEYAQTEAPQLDMDKRRAEWFLSTYSDGDWSFSHYVAGSSAHKWIRNVAEDMGIDPESPEAAILAWFVLTRVSDFKLYKIYEDADFSTETVEELIHDVLADSTAYEVK
ncbi:hypothetical protein [Roseovarius arcticus]|uniref:hypothetical protein n=1 Tax=Roseovarius arcticus TaxID=2547404 RepID=UPI0011104A3B|nr:hypothetical protein [Roseovarius arcticus]